MLSHLLFMLALASPEPEGASSSRRQEEARSSFPVILSVSSQIGQDDAAIEQEVIAKLTPLLEQEGFHPSDRADRLLSVVITWSEGYQVKVSFSLRQGEPFQRVESFECEACSPTRLLEEIQTNVSALLPALKDNRLPEQERRPLSTQSPATEPPADASPPIQTDEPRRSGLPLFGSGLALTSLGAATVAGTGVGMIVRNRDDQELELGHYTALGVGAAALAAGIPMLIIGKKRLADTTPTLSAVLDSTQVGLVVRGRF